MTDVQPSSKFHEYILYRYGVMAWTHVFSTCNTQYRILEREDDSKTKTATFVSFVCDTWS